MKILTFLGAGAAIEIGGPSGNFLTQKVRQTIQVYMGVGIPIIDRIAQILNANMYPQETNFEEIFHTIEMLDTYYSGQEKAVNKKYRPSIVNFINLNEEFSKIFEPLEDQKEMFEMIPFSTTAFLGMAKNDIIKCVSSHIFAYNSKAPEDWFSNFWKDLNNRYKLDIATLNYDTKIEQVLPYATDGFVDIDGYNFKRFSPAELSKKSLARIMHLHGCITYGYANYKDPNQFHLLDDREDLVKFESLNFAKSTWQSRLDNYTQSGDQAVIGPIITGLRKMDKLFAYPYGWYYNQLWNSLIESRGLFIIGYSFGDLHFNSILHRILSVHKNPKIVIIDFIDFQTFPCKQTHSFEGWPITSLNPKFEYFSRFLQTPEPLKVIRAYEIEKGLPVISPNGNCMIFFKGFKDAVNNHFSKIVNFFQ